ncbi:MAG: CapA family protein [Candidatus Hodarchaeota archaeon]
MTKKIELIITGDLCPDERIEKLCLNDEYNKIFNDALQILKEKDFSITNLECPLTLEYRPIEKDGPNLIANPKCAKAIKYAEIDAVTLANNHILDQGQEGLNKTISICNKLGIKTVGAGANLKAASMPLYVHIKGISIAIINIAENEFSIATKERGGANPLNLVDNYFQITEAKKNADIVIVIVHGGHEHYSLPSPRMVKTYRFFADIGASAVIGHHTHCFSGYEIYKNVPIFYSLGNFVFDRKYSSYSSWYYGYFIKITFIGDHVENINIFPYEQCNEDIGIHLLAKNRKSKRLQEIDKLSKIIEDQEMLESKWYEFCDKKRSYYLNVLLRNGKIKSRLINKRFFRKYYLNSKKLLPLQNMFSCEAHSEAMLQTIRNEY